MEPRHPNPGRSLTTLAGAVFSIIFLFHPVQAANTAQKVLGQAGEALSIRQKTQELVDRQTPKIDKCKDRIEFLEGELKLLLRQRAKTTAYLEDQRSKVAELKRRLEELEIIRRDLEPLLDQTSERLSKKLQEDLPFAMQERRIRLERLNDKLNDFDAGLADKIRALLETLGVEAGYGLSVEVNESEVELASRAQRVKLLRLGRLGLFALSLDGERAWSLEPQGGKWRQVHEYARQLNLAAEIAQRQRVVSLVELPMPKPGAAAASREPKKDGESTTEQAAAPAFKAGKITAQAQTAPPVQSSATGEVRP